MIHSTSSSPFVTRQLTVNYGSKRALDNVSLTLPAQGITALLGANGAGKTTLINCALGLRAASRGTVKVLNGKPGAKNTKQQLGVMLQDSDLPDLLSAREHIDLFRSYYPNPFPADELISLCDLGEFADQRYKHLSGGQKRRIQFALAILGRPKLVFLDEPTTGLDIDARRVLWNTIRKLRDAGTAIVLTTHYLEEADTLADHIVVIHDGNIIANAPTQQIRAAASGAVIRCESALDISHIESLGHVRSVQKSGRYFEILSNDGPATLRELLNADPGLSGLSVNTPSLEQAFVELRNGHANSN